ncbi:MAG TPA: DNA polymerase IV [Chiayiivirga sp.]|nr:DNA polymerase IV [Chiayiivirga sp.]
MVVPTRKIVHVDMDAFYASVEQRDDPALRGKPVVVAWRGSRSVVCAASYEARRFGIRSAMPAVTAERLCPQAIFVPPDFTRYKAVSHQVRDIFARHTDLIEPLSLDEAYLDVSQPRSDLPSATAIAESIRCDIRTETGLTASAGVAPNKFLAKIASDWNKPDGLFVIRPRQALAFLEPLPVSRLPGVGKVTAKHLEELGVLTVGQLRVVGEAALSARFGRWGQRLHALSMGIDEHAVEANRPTQSISCEDTFAQDLPLADLEPQVRALAERTFASYQQQRQHEPDRLGRTVVLKLKTADFRILTRSLTPSALPEDVETFCDIAWHLHERVNLPVDTRYRLAGVGIGGFIDIETGIEQGELFDTRDG